MHFIARIEDSQREKIREIAGSLEKMGAKVREVLPVLGLITGSSEALSLEQVKIKGVAAVELDRKWGAGMPEGANELKDAPKAEEKHAEAKRSGGNAKRKD